MADDFDYDGDGDYDEDVWLYVEDAAEDLADDLVEQAVPSPGYTGVAEELSLLVSDYDFYEYFQDLEYGDDGYWDDSSGSRKRKREAGESDEGPLKRKKIEIESEEPVIFMSRSDRIRHPEPPTLVSNGTFALMPDWREKFGYGDGTGMTGAVSEATEMPLDMKRAASAAAATASKDGDKSEEEGWEDDGDESMAAEEGEDESPSAKLDPQMLKMILQQRLAEAGLSGSEHEAAFMQSIQQMLSGEAAPNEEDASDALAKMLLGQATGEGDGDTGAVSSWLEGQGVKFGEAAEEDGVSTTDSPMDSGVALSSREAGELGREERGLESGSLGPGRKSTSRKRKAEPANNIESGPGKRVKGKGRSG